MERRAMSTHLADKQAVHAYARALAHPGFARWEAAALDLFAPSADINVCHPFNKVTGAAGLLKAVLEPLAASFEGLYRRDDILMGGTSDGHGWVSCHGNYAGHFARDWLGLRASGRMEYLRFGEFHRLEGGRVVESFVFLDIPQLAIATGQWPIATSPGRDRGYTGFLPGPTTQDGILLRDSDPARSESSKRLVEVMLAGLATKDESWRPYWHPNMVWYGPAAFGSFLGIENFAGFQVPFEQAFSVWSGGSRGNGVTRHFTRFGDGDYVCSGGWPSLMAVQRAPFLGQPSRGDMLLMRVSDWWRREGDLLIENWVFVDIPDVLLQMGLDLFPGRHDVLPGPRRPAAEAQPS
jgi:hypothetical protein